MRVNIFLLNGTNCKMVTCLVFLCLINLSITSALNQCSANQILRKNKDGVEKCCSTVKCRESQIVKNCTYDGGSDKCIDCPPGTYTGDTFNTKQFPSYDQENREKEPRICVSLPSCDAREKILVGTKCRCNLDKGYFGEDSNNCLLDQRNCTNRGVQLTIQGQCVPCPADAFKPEDGYYRQCRSKTKCQSNEEETFPGSNTTDRMCIKKEITEATTVNTPVVNIPSAPDKSSDKKSTPVEAWLVPLLIVIVIVMILVLFGCYRYRQRILEFWKKLKGKHHRKPEGHELEPLRNSLENGTYVELRTESEVDTNINPNGLNGHHYENGRDGYVYLGDTPKSHNSKNYKYDARSAVKPGKKNETCTKRPIGKVLPMIRPDTQNQHNLNVSQNDGPVQDFPPSNTTAGGLTVGAASNNGASSSKFVPSHANRMEYDSGHGGNLAAAGSQDSNDTMNDQSQESSSQYSNPSVSQPLSSIRFGTTEPEGNETSSSESGTPHTFRTSSGREVYRPESENSSEESSIEDNTQ